MATTENDLRAVIETAKQASYADKVGQTILVGGSTFIMMPDNSGKLALQNMDAFMPVPVRAPHEARLDTLQSFLEYFNRYANSESTVYFKANGGEIKCTAVIDHHGKDHDDWGSHKLSYSFPTTPEWQDWKSGNKQPKSQEAFAQFVEDHLDDIITPDGATMLEIAKSLQAKNNVAFSRAIRLDNGEVQFKYVEEINGTAGANGTLEIPADIELGLRLFLDGQVYRMRARFRYRIQEGKLQMWYDLVQPHRVIEDAANSAFATVCDGIKIGHVYRGSL